MAIEVAEVRGRVSKVGTVVSSGQHEGAPGGRRWLMQGGARW
ncbi:hypothetical protein [Streptomyces sp. NPDC000188]